MSEETSVVGERKEEVGPQRVRKAILIYGKENNLSGSNHGQLDEKQSENVLHPISIAVVLESEACTNEALREDCNEDSQKGKFPKAISSIGVASEYNGGGS